MANVRQETFKYKFKDAEKSDYVQEHNNTLRISYEGNKATIIELLDDRENIIAKTKIRELSSSQRKLADAERTSGFITNQPLFLTRLWELVQEKAVDIINESIFKFKIRKNGEVVCNKTDIDVAEYNTLRVSYVNDKASIVELLSKDGSVMTRTDICKLSASQRALADVQRVSGFVTDNRIHILRLLEMIQDETADFIVA